MFLECIKITEETLHKLLEGNKPINTKELLRPADTYLYFKVKDRPQEKTLVEAAAREFTEWFNLMIKKVKKRTEREDRT